MQNIVRILVLGWLSTSLLSHAALFDDKEARKKILDVEAHALSDHQAQQTQIEALNKRIQQLESLVNSNGLLQMQNQIEGLKQENAQLKGDLEVVNHQLEQSQLRQKDLYTDTDTRLRQLEAVKTNASSAATTEATPTASQADAKSYAEADALLQSSKYKDAFSAFDAFLKAYPNSQFKADALYGMGYAQFGLKNYKSSIATQQKLLDAYEDHPKAPDAMYNMANSQIQLAQVSAAKKTLSTLVAKYPDATVTPDAKKRLKVLESIK